MFTQTVGGNAPKTAIQIVMDALEAGNSLSELKAELEQDAARHLA